MNLTYKSVNGIIYENVMPIFKLKLDWQIHPKKRIVYALYNNNLDYFYVDELYSENYTFEQIDNYVDSLTENIISNLNECRSIVNIVQYRYFGTLELYMQRLESEKIAVDMFKKYVGTTQNPTTTTTTTTSCPFGLVLSRVYNLNISGDCAICEPTNDFTCMNNINENKENCEFNASQLNNLNPICDTSPPPPI